MAIKYVFLFFTLLLLLHIQVCFGLTPEDTPIILKHFNGTLLNGNYSVNLIFYGSFSSVKASIISEFISSLSGPPSHDPPSVGSWWATISHYNMSTIISLGAISMDPNCSLGKDLSSKHIQTLAQNLDKKLHVKDSITAVLTSADVNVDEYCSSGCGSHGWLTRGLQPYLFVGTPVEGCDGGCDWPFSPDRFNLVPPNGDMGVDAMILGLATELVDTVTNPYTDGYHDDLGFYPPFEAGSTCNGNFASHSNEDDDGPGNLLIDATTGARYNALGIHGRKYLLPSLWDPQTSGCETLT